MRKIIAFWVVLSLLIGQSVLAAEGFEDVGLEPEYELCCGEQSLIEELHESLIQKRLLETQQQFYTDFAQPANIMPYLKGAVLMPSTGNVKMLVLPISYLDTRQYEENFDMEEWEARFFAPYDPELKLWEQSVRGFYYAASYGQLDITGTVLPVYRAPQTGKKYDDDPDLADKLYTEALTYYCEQGLDISQFDNDGDGSVDALVIHQLRKGSTEHSYAGVARGVNGTIDGYDINTAAIIFHQELEDLGGRVYEHEIGHLLGLLDNYNASAGNSVIGAKAYELMSSGTYINVYYKYLLGWIDPIILTEEDPVQTLEISAVELQPNGVDTPPKAILLIPNAVALPFTEYYIAEYRAGGVKEQREGREDLIYDLNPGIVIWHCNTRLNEHLQYKYDTNYLKPVPRSENTTYSEKDIRTTGAIFSSNSIPSTNSDFYDGTYTGIYMKVGEITPEKTIVQAGFRFPDLTPAPMIEVSLPSKTVIRKGERSTVVITTKLGDELLSPDLVDYRNLFKFSTSGTVTSIGTAGSALVNPFTVTIPGYTNTGLGADGTIWVDIPAGAVRYNGKDSAAVTSEKIYVDNTPPEITLQGANPQRIQHGTAYTELGATASDNLDPDIEGKLEIDTSQVNTNALGSYTVTYSVTDHAGHSTAEVRTVIVEEGPPPHTHDYVTAWSSDETGHWHECECGEKGDFVAHTVVTDPAVESTCTTQGKTAGSHCSVCEYVIQKQVATQPLGHSYSNKWDQDENNHWHECTRCQDKKELSLHMENAGAVTKQPTVDETGIKTYSCSTCGRELRTEIIAKLEPSHNHNYSTTWAMDGTNHWHECECGDKTDLGAHTEVIDPAVESTCTTHGKTQGSHCSVCGYVIKAQTETPLKTHSYPETWSSDNTNHWHECTICKEKTAQAIHAWNGGVVTTASTSTKTGVRTYTCTVCQRIRAETIPATGGTSSPGGGSGGGGSVAVEREYTVSIPGKTEGGNVKADLQKAAKGKTVTLTVEPDPEHEPERITVKDKNGKDVSLTEGKDGRYTFTMPGSDVEVAVSFREIVLEPPVEITPEPPVEITPEPVKLPFADVAETAWYYEAVQTVYEQGIMTGMNETLFEPELPTSRGMVVTILYRMEGEPTAKAEETFTDVPVGRYYADAVAWAVENGIVTGYGDGTFRPDTRITREQLVTILYRYWAKKGYDVTERADLSGFFDEDRITGYAREAMEWANATGLLHGADWGGIDPGGTATRGQVAAVLIRFFALR